jgi:uncharacterized protein (DUF885 family)
MASRRDLLLSGGAAVVGAVLPRFAAAEPQDDADRLNALLGRTSDALLAEFPENATFLGLDKGRFAALEGKLTDRSVDGDAARGAACRERLARLRAFDGSRLTGLDRINLQTAVYAHELAAEGYRFPYGDNAVLNTWQAESNSAYAVSQGTGVFATIPDFMDNNQRLDTRDDAEADISRLSELARGLDAENGRMRRDAAAGSIAPDFLLDTTLKQQGDYAAEPVASWGLVTSIARRATEKGITGDWAARAQRLCEREVAPALARQIETLKALRAKATPDAGVWKLPQGDGFYRWALKAGTTTDMSPDEVHQLGLEQVKLIGAEMDGLLRAQGLTQGTVGERMGALSKDPRFLFPDTDAGRAQLLAYLNGVIAAIRAKLPQAFGILHKADLVIKRVPPSIDGPIDGSRPATYYINLRDTGNWPKFSLPTLCFHEGLPGHVWQGTFVHDLPVIRSQLAFNAYIEGWALYAEQLGEELGMYTDDPFGRLGYLQSIQFRACRLVVDTGLHAKRWTREQAIDWMVANNGGPRDSARGEIDRYCAWPGQACGYQIGHLRIDGLRRKAKAALGARFDLKGFDDAVLTCGSLPLALLDGVVDGWIAHVRRA